jgi:phenol hydroxylase P0 protein
VPAPKIATPPVAPDAGSGQVPEPAQQAADWPATGMPRKFAHVLERHVNGLVRFEFAVGWPDLGCELVLPSAMFEAFCQQHQVEFMTAADRLLNRSITGDHVDDEH